MVGRTHRRLGTLIVALLANSLGCDVSPSNPAPAPAATIALHDDVLPLPGGAVAWERHAGHAAAEHYQLHAQARDLAARGELTAALTRLAQLAVTAPGWVEPMADAARLYLLLDDPPAATRAYQAVALACPRGFRETRPALDGLARVAAGTLPRELLGAWIALTWEGDRALRRGVLHQLRRQASWPPLDLAYALDCDDRTSARAAIEAALAKAPDPDTRAELLVLHAAALAERDPAAARAQLRAIANDAQQPLAGAERARWLLTRLALQAD